MGSDRFLISTKLAPPRIRANAVRRARLLALMAQAGPCTLTLVVAGAGFGKTTLLAQCRQELLVGGAEVGWLSLSPDDGALPAFATYLFEVLRRLGVELENDALLLLDGENTVSADSLALALVNGIARRTQPLHLFIDDYHHVVDPRAHRLLQRLLDHAPPNLQLRLASRCLPALALSRLRVTGQLTEVDSLGLPFDPAEARVFLDDAVLPRLSPVELRTIFDLSGGWPASLQLLCIALRRRPEERAGLSRLVGKTGDLHAYLQDEVVAHLPPALAAFAESVSICRRFDAAVAGALTGDSASTAWIERLVAENLFIYPVELNEGSGWYRFHPLFAEFLGVRLARRDPEALRELHRRASTCFAQRGLLAEALRHADQAGDERMGRDLITRTSPGRWNLTDLGPLLRWLDRLPAHGLEAGGELNTLGCLAYALTAQPAQAGEWLARLGDDVPAAHKALARAAIALQADDTAQAQVLLDAHPVAVTDVPFFHSAYVIAGATSFAAHGRFADARALGIKTAALQGPGVPRDHECVAEVSATTLVDLLQGDVDGTAKLGTALLRRVERWYGRRSIAANLCASLVADACYELDRIDDARELLANRLDMLRVSTPEAMLRAALCHARIEALRESAEQGMSALDEAYRHFHRLQLDRGIAAVLAEQIALRLRSTASPECAAAQRELDALAGKHAGATGFRAEIVAYAALSRGRLRLAAGDGAGALAALALMGRFAVDCGRMRVQAHAELLCVLALFQIGRVAQARARLGPLTVAAAARGWRRLWLDEAPHATRMLMDLLDPSAFADPLADPVSRLRAYLAQRDRVTVPDQPARSPKALSVAPRLTAREREILGLLAQSMSNKRIALTLSLTLETVKWNMKNIFAKLGVGSRYDALVAARGWGLTQAGVAGSLPELPGFPPG